MGKKNVSSTNDVGKTGSNMKKDETRPLSYTIQKINSKCLEDINVRLETIKILEKNTGNNFFDLKWSNIFLDMYPEAKETKSKIYY